MGNIELSEFVRVRKYSVGASHGFVLPTVGKVFLFTVGLTASLLVLLISEGVPRFDNNHLIPKHYFLGGLLVIFYILSITWVAPKFGIANAISFVLLGQLISMTLIDHFSLFDSIRYELSLQRSIGLILMIMGVFLVVKKSI